MVRGVALCLSDVVDELVNELLERAALPGTGLLGLAELHVVLAFVEQASDLLAQLGDLPVHRARLLRVCLAHALDLAHVALLGVEHRLAEARLDREQGVGAVLGRERLQQRVAMLARLRRHDLLDLRLHGVASLGAKGRGDPLGELLGALLERAAELAVELSEPLLELVAHVVDVRGGRLAVEHPSADLDRLADRLGRGPSRLGAVADQPRRALVLHRERLDHEPVVEGADDAVGRFSECELGFLRCFHEDSRR